MITTAIISFREFLEAFLIVGVFLGISRKLNLKKEFEIGLAAVIGVVFSLLLATGTYLFGNQVHGVLTEKNAELLEGYLMVFSGLFIAYVIFSLHDVISRSRAGTLIKIKQKLQEKVFDFSLFSTIVFLVIREGFEIALFTASTSLFFIFIQNFIGLMLGFVSASIVGVMTFFAYIKFSIGKIFRLTEYMIIILGAALVQNGITELLEHGLNIHLSKIMSFPLNFLPHKSSLIGHMMKSFFGIDREFSFSKLAIMGGYVLIIYLLRRRSAHSLNRV
ncbi:MAG: Iron permease FTR1 [Candidatus Levybacteria bacterium GW2011_GWA2_37_36]|uniref:Iron permease FTR1 n=1 Tax=Candidatus Roizmanbacteria bacterium GW2011_GWC2_34_23 TaxID=1618484 RepID=A0A0G0DES1_9BACT|nr:MAG: Iron permease FTR1 [Candidatus Roizmanbacteria bacterium GW2011_GWC2_34_23]KKQ33823.1 MAG: Iron permease FTR1 [Candidatus Levybacteria bacterium GW2011_GWA2_37_36]